MRQNHRRIAVDPLQQPNRFRFRRERLLHGVKTGRAQAYLQRVFDGDLKLSSLSHPRGLTLSVEIDTCQIKCD